MRTIKLFFADFSTDFVVQDDCFYKVIAKNYHVVLDRDHPDYLIYSCYGFDHLKYDCVKIFYTAENIRPDFNLCDFAIGFDYIEFADRYLRFPNYARYGEQFESLVTQPKLTSVDVEYKSAFCNFIYSNPFADPQRDRFFHLLSQYKRVDSCGRHLNNMASTAGDRYDGSWRQSKVDFQRRYKFTIAFENSFAPGYTTEKIMHAFAAQTIPIYWGNPLVGKEFNPAAFVNCHDYSSFDEVMKRISVIDQDDALYLQIVNTDCFVGRNIPRELSEETIRNFFQHIFNLPIEAARLRPRYGTTYLYEQNARFFAQCLALRERSLKIRGKVGQVKRFLTGNR